MEGSVGGAEWRRVIRGPGGGKGCMGVSMAGVGRGRQDEGAAGKGGAQRVIKPEWRICS